MLSRGVFHEYDGGCTPRIQIPAYAGMTWVVWDMTGWGGNDLMRGGNDGMGAGCDGVNRSETCPQRSA